MGLQGYSFWQLEVDCMHRVDKLIALDLYLDALEHGRVPLAAAPCDSMTLNSERLRDRNAAFMIYYAVAGDLANDLKYFVASERNLLLSRAGARELFCNLCVPMETTLKQNGTWNVEKSRPSSEIRLEIEAMMHLEPGHYNDPEAGKWWADFYTTGFENATPLLRDRNVLLKAGTAYFHASDEMLKHLCGIKITHFIQSMQKTLIRKNSEQRKQVDWLCDSIVARLRRAYAARSGSSAQEARFPAELKHLLQLDSIFNTVMQRAPLCMASLLLKLKASHRQGFNTGLNHEQRKVLIMFLNASGVERQVSMTLFGDLSGLDEKSFKKKYGKSIDYVYSKDYKSCGCAKIQDLGLCPFQSKTRALEIVQMAKVTVDIEECYVSNPPPCVSCSLYYKKCQGSRWKQDKIKNPKTYFANALVETATAKRARSPDAEVGAPAAKRAPLTEAQRARIETNRQAALERRRITLDAQGSGTCP